MNTSGHGRKPKNQAGVYLRTSRVNKRSFKKLNMYELGLFLILVMYLDVNSNLVVGDGETGNTGEPLSLTQIDKIAGIVKQTRAKALDGLVQKGFVELRVHKNKRTVIYVNPDYASYDDGLKTPRNARERNSLRAKEWKADVLDRDNYKCVECGGTEVLHAHHIVSWEDDPTKRFDINNGITLCNICHAKKHPEYSHLILRIPSAGDSNE